MSGTRVQTLTPSDREEEQTIQRFRVLLLCDDDPHHANTVIDHIHSLVHYSRHEVRVFNPKGMGRSIFLDFNEFDVVVIHYSLYIIFQPHLSGNFVERLRNFSGLKVQFIQDEYRCVNEVVAMMRHLNIDVLFTLMPPAEVGKVYSSDSLPGVATIHTLAGYVPEKLLSYPAPPLVDRPIDIGYRGRRVPFWLGRHSQEKFWIGEGVLSRAAKYGLRCDISSNEDQRLYGERWTKFLTSCRAVLGTESGSSIVDYDGSVELKTKKYLAQVPDADFQEVSREVLDPYEGNVKYYAISPRVFEAAALRTAMVLFPGEYSGILQPWVHYIPLQKDFSNLNTVVEKVRDTAFLERLTTTAFRDLVESGRYSQQAFADQFDSALDRHVRVPRYNHRILFYRLARSERVCKQAILEGQRRLRPVFKWMEKMLKGILGGVLMIQSGAERMFILAFWRNRNMLREVSFDDLFADLLKLQVAREALRVGWGSRGTYRVLPRFETQGTKLILESVPQEACEFPEWDEVRSPPHTLSAGEWAGIHSALFAGELQVVWDHSAVGGKITLSMLKKLGLGLYLGNFEIHRFEGLTALGKQCPQEALTYFENLLK